MSAAFLLMINSSAVHALSTELQATVLNAAINGSPVIKVEALKAKMVYLYNTLDNAESLVLTQHPNLKISSYMYLMKLWEQKSLNDLLKMRGVDVRKLYLPIETAGFNPDLMDVPLYKFGSAAIPLEEQCSSVSNPIAGQTIFQLWDVLGVVEQEIGNLNSLAAEAMVFFIKISTLMRLHDPIMTHAKTTNKCVSDFEGMLTCADGFFDMSDVNEQVQSLRYSQVEDMALNDRLVNDNVNRKDLVSWMGQCYVPMRYLTATAGMTNPLGDEQVISLSEIIYKNQQVRLHSSTPKFSLEQQIKLNFNALDVAYNFPRYVKENGLKGSKSELIKLRNQFLKKALFKRIESSTVSAVAFVKETELLK